MKSRRTALAIFVAAFLAGCGPSASDAEGSGEEGHDHGAEGGGASFKEGKGLSLAGETREALGLTTVEVAPSTLEPVVNLTAQVYRAAGEDSGEGVALAAATVDPSIAPRIPSGAKVRFALGKRSLEGTVRTVDPTQTATIGKAEVLLDLPDPARGLAIGAFVPVTVRLPSVEATSIPRSAVLETSTGKFAYVKNGDFLLRTPVTTGIESPDAIEITDGLYDGDVVVTNPVEPLYLIELRATKGGGHCH